MGALYDMYRMKPSSKLRLSVAKIVSLYILCGILWIVFTDYWLNHEVLPKESLKGILYVLITGLLLYLLMKSFMKQILEAKQRAKRSEESFREIFQHANDGIALFSINEYFSLQFIDSNDLFQRMSGYDKAELRSIPPFQYIHSRDGSFNVLDLMKTGARVEEVEIHQKDGSIVSVEVNSQTFKKRDRMEVVSVFRDITERKQADKLIQFLANHDYLTSLPNPRVLYDELNRSLSESEAFSLLVIQIDRFKWLRHTLGRTNSNELLVQIARRLKEAMDRSSVITRISDESFKALVPNLNKQECLEGHGRIEELLAKPFLIGGDEVRLHFKIGVSSYPDDGEDEESLIRLAYYNLNQTMEDQPGTLWGKQQGTDFKRTVVMENELPLAVSKNQFTLLYQPKIILPSQEIIGVEALLRWNHPVLGIISPIEFIPIAEEMGEIVPIGEWVLLEACRQMKIFQEISGAPLTVSVNISSRQFVQRNFVDVVKQAIQSTGIEPKHLVLEITESMTIHFESSIDVLGALKELGVTISMDDFGTGYSSLSYLKHLPIDELKIDRSFIRDILHQAYDRNLVQTMITLAHHMNMQVVAEGVEDSEQLDCLQELDCDLVQGYLFSPPVAPDFLMQMLQRKPI